MQLGRQSKEPPKSLFKWLTRREKDKLVQFIINTKKYAYTKEKAKRKSGGQAKSENQKENA